MDKYMRKFDSSHETQNNKYEKEKYMIDRWNPIPSVNRK